jgi:hypothetical protein
MSITITPTDARDALTLTGDITRTIPLPAERSSGSLFIAVSDGTLLHASLTDDAPERFSVAHEGAGIMVLAENSAEVQWPIEWLTIAGVSQSLTIKRQPEPLPLFPEAA